MAAQCCNFLGEAMLETFTPSVGGFGLGDTSGSRQKMEEKKRELLLATTMEKG